MATAHVDDPLLKQTLAKVEASVPEKQQRGYHQTMAAGMQAMFSEKTFPMMEEYLKKITGPQDVPNLVSHGIVKLISMLYNESQGKMSMEASGSAAIALMVHALDYVDTALKMKVTKEILDETTKLTTQGWMHLLKQISKLSDADFEKALTPKQPGEAAAPTEAPVEGTQPVSAEAGAGILGGV